MGTTATAAFLATHLSVLLQVSISDLAPPLQSLGTYQGSNTDYYDAFFARGHPKNYPYRSKRALQKPLRRSPSAVPDP